MQSYNKSIKIKNVYPGYMNYIDSLKYPFNENTTFNLLLKHTGLLLRNIFDVLKAIFYICIFSLFLKLIYPLDIENIGKKSFLTGLPILRNMFFLPPIFLQTVVIILVIALYLNKKIKEKYSFKKYLDKLNFFMLPSFILKIFIFYYIYNNMINVTYDHFNFKISGHFLATVITSSMIVNIMIMCETFIRQDFKKKKLFDNKSNLQIYYLP